MLFNIFTSHGTIVGINPITGELIHGDKNKIVPLVGFYASSGGYFFVAGNGMDFEINLGMRKRNIGIFHITSSMLDQSKVSIKDNLTEKFMAAEPDGGCVVNRPEVRDWEKFIIAPILTYELSEAYRQRVLRLSVWTKDALIAQFSLKDALEMAVGSLSGRDLLDYFKYIEEDYRFTSWSDLVGGRDPWLDANSSPLNTWAGGDRSRSPSSQRDRLSHSEHDYLANMVPEGQFASPGHVVATYLRSRVEPTRKCCIVTTVRNEGVYLIDWISYHKSIGIDQIFVYSNNNDDGSDVLLEALDAAGEIIWMRNSVDGGTSPQYKAYGHAFGLQSDVLNFEWALLIDLDEYLVIDKSKFGNVGEFLDWQRDLGASSIMLTWQVVGSSGQALWHDRPVPERFDDRQAREPTLTKCFTKPNITVHSHCHFPWIGRLFPTRCLDARGELVPEFSDSKETTSTSILARATRNAPILENAWINHYWYKSTEEFLARRTYAGGGESIVNNPTIPPIFAAHFAGQESERPDQKIKRFSSGMFDVKSKILAVPEIREAHDQVLSQYAMMLDQKIKSNMASDDASVLGLVNEVMAAKSLK